MKNYFYHYQGVSYGPYTKEEILKLNLPPETQIWDSTIEEWKKMEEISDFLCHNETEAVEKAVSANEWYRYMSFGKSSYYMLSKLKKYTLSFWVMIGLLMAIFVSVALTYQHIASDSFKWNFTEFLSLLGVAGVSFILRTAAFIACLIFIITLLEIIFFTWKIIEMDDSSISASKSIGFLFIPFFNVWWAYFIIIHTNEQVLKFALKRNIKMVHVMDAKFLISTAILSMLFFVPVVGFFVLIPFLILQYIYIQRLTENTVEIYRYFERNRPN